MYDLNQYAKDQLHRSQQLQEAQQRHLSDLIDNEQATKSQSIFPKQEQVVLHRVCHSGEHVHLVGNHLCR